MKLNQFMKENHIDLRNKYRHLSAEDLEHYRDLAEDNRYEKVSLKIRHTPKARLKDVDNSFEKMKELVSVLCSQGCVS